MITRPALKLNWDGTNRILRAAVKKAEEIAIPVSIAVVDDGGHLLGFARTDKGNFVTFSGGFSILVAGHCVGGIGVSGGSGEQDAEVAQAGLAALAAV